jgi:hypothetical protein
MRKALFAPILAAVAFVATGNAATHATLKGVVIARMPAQHQLVLASAGGRTTTLRAATLPAPGAVLRVTGTSLQVVGHVHHTVFHGVLVRTVGSTSFYAAGRSVVAVHTATRSVASATRSSDDLTPGEAGEIEVTITAGGTLDQQSVTPTPSGDENQAAVQVTITAVTPPTATTAGSLTLSVNGQPLVLPLPAGTVLPPAFVANAVVGLTIELKQPGLGDDDQGEDQGDDDNNATTTTTTTTTTASLPTTTTSTTPFGHHDGDGGDHHGGGGDD